MNPYKDLFSLEGKTVLVTGGSSGLGHAIASAFLQSKANVVICARNPEAADLCEYAASIGTGFLAVKCDITKSHEINYLVEQIKQTFQTIDILVNSAGINLLLKAEDYEEESFSKVMDINVTGLHLVTKSIGKQFMIPQKYGRILNLSSVKGSIGASEDYLAYCTSKGAVNMYTKQLACEWGKYNITSNAIAPTFVRTPINSNQLDDPSFYKQLLERIPLGKIGTFEDVACAALYLCSDAAKFVTGQILYVDGGLTSRQ